MSEIATRLIESVEQEFGRFEENEDTITALIGAMALAFEGKDYSKPGDDYAAGVIVRYKASPDGRMEEQGKRLMVSLLLAGLSPDHLQRL